MQISSVERTALGVVALMLSLGIAARTFAPGPSAPVWQESAADSSGATLPGRVAEEAAREERRSLPLGRGERIDPNTASADELDRLPRVGPALAARIVEWRSAHGPFATLADLESVAGVGPATLERLAPHLALPSAPTAVSAPLPAAVAAAPVRRVDVNRADAAELQTLPGIGPALASRIVEHRESHGPFRSTADLQQVRGIGPRLTERLAQRVSTAP